ncbi:AraC family transcriptional regulator [Variovorax terrae]|uniref:AraC family transcriptional regulator n=1 Tax=Variovorax terrae TaxID=2923278 RepID=A0A9X2AN91_9BURK|nr:AraC family transcriptional regulator [Variovorax terrae]MCJ0762157.1 AraC family transcriptional regulator [Variovorax terrae]
MPEELENLSLLTSDQLSRWQGLPVGCLGTPGGSWQRKFTPQITRVSLLSTGNMGSRLSSQGRSAELDIDAGSFAIFNPDIEVKVNHRGAFQAQRILLDLDTRALVRQGFLDDQLVTTPLRQSLHFSDPSLAAVMRAMVHEIRLGCPNGALFAESLSVGAVLHLCRTRGVRAPSLGQERGKLNPWQWARIEEMIAHDLAADLSLSALSSATGMSKAQFVRLFRNSTGTSPHRYVLEKRVERARKMIQSNSASLFDIALEAGFASQAHMTRSFQDILGVTPGAARKYLKRK